MIIFYLLILKIFFYRGMRTVNRVMFYKANFQAEPFWKKFVCFVQEENLIAEKLFVQTINDKLKDHDERCEQEINFCFEWKSG